MADVRPAKASDIGRLAIVSAAIHYRWQGQLWSHEAYVREIDLWSELAPEIELIGPVVDEEPPGDGIPFSSPGVTIEGVPPTGGETIGAKLHQLLLLPLLVGRMCRALRRADAVHVRAPGNMGLLGILLAPLFSRRLVAKYAGQWTGFPGEVWTVRLQRALLRSWWWRGPVTVYGEWPDQPAKVVPFFTSVLTDEQVAAGTAAAGSRHRDKGQLHVLFVGRLTGPKNVATVIRAVARAAEQGVDIRCTVLGDGGERQNLETIAREEQVADRVVFRGAVPMADVLATYREGDTLALVSESEGWPKAIAEAMTYGLACIGSDRGLVPQMLGAGRGRAVTPRDVDALAATFRWLADHPDEADAMGREAAEWASHHSLERLGTAIRELLAETWGTGQDRPVSVLQVTDTLDAGGAERVAVNLANGLDRAHYRASLCTTRRVGSLAGLVRPDVARLDLHRSSRWHDVRAIRRLARFLREEPVDIVHAHGTSLFIAAAACLLVPSTTLVWHDHLGGAVETRQRTRWFYRLAASRATLVIAVTRALRAWDIDRLGLDPERVVRLPNFVLRPEADGPPPVLPGHAGRRVVSVANLRPHKDHVTLLRAMARVAERLPDAHALLMGAEIDHEVGAAVRAEIASRQLQGSVTLLGPRVDVEAVLEQCDVGVLSSRSEGFPLALLEYGRAGIAAVSTDVGECRDILDDGQAGAVVPSGDPQALADAIVDLLEDPARAAVLGRRLQERVAERFSPESVLHDVEALYERAREDPK